LYKIAPASPGTHLVLFMDDTCIYEIKSELQCSLTAVKLCRMSWNIKINEEKTRAIYFSGRCKVLEDVLQLNGQNIPSVNNVKYPDVILDRRMTWRLHIERTKAKALNMYIRMYSVFKIGSLNINIKLTVYSALIRPIMVNACTTWEYGADSQPVKLQCL
jgi:hypothetical protein